MTHIACSEVTIDGFSVRQVCELRDQIHAQIFIELIPFGAVDDSDVMDFIYCIRIISGSSKQVDLGYVIDVAILRTNILKFKK